MRLSITRNVELDHIALPVHLRLLLPHQLLGHHSCSVRQLCNVLQFGNVRQLCIVLQFGNVRQLGNVREFRNVRQLCNVLQFRNVRQLGNLRQLGNVYHDQAQPAFKLKKHVDALSRI